MSTAQHFREAVECLNEFYNHIDDAYGLYLDSTLAMQAFSSFLTGLQNNHISKDKIYTDGLQFAYGNSNNGAGPFRVQHISTQGDVKIRNAKGGRNEKTMSRLLLITIYQFWEDFYRKRFAKFCQKEKNDIVSDFFGDIRHIRNGIIHNNNRATDEINKCKILRYFENGDEIFLSSIQVEDLIDQLRKEISRMSQHYTGHTINLPQITYS